MQTNQPLTLTIEQAGRVLGVGRSTAYELVRSGELKSLRLRRRIVVPVAHLADRLGVTPAQLCGLLREHSSVAGPPPTVAVSRPPVTPAVRSPAEGKASTLF